MKILQIKFKNINSLKGEHCIDFEEEPLKSNSLFAITGPTGSGKSTLLDVICLALFNQIPRMNKVSRTELAKTKAVITRHQKDAYAEVVYESAAGKFLSHWDIQYNRNDNLNDYEMRIKNLILDEELDLKKSDVPAKNEVLIGLNYQQFIKSILLAQGEFAKFLQAKDSERKQLLEQITGTAIYRKIGIIAFEKAKTVQDAIKENKRRIEDVKEKLWDKVALAEAETKYKKQEEEKEKLNKEKEKRTKEQDLLQEKNKLTKDLASSKIAFDNVEKKLKTFLDSHEEKIKQHIKTQSFAEDLQSWTNQQSQLRKLANEKEQLQKQLNQLQKDQEALFKKIESLLPKAVNSEQVIFQLEEFRLQVNQLKNSLYEIRNSYKHIYHPLKEKFAKLQIEYNKKTTETLVQEVKQKVASWYEEEQHITKHISDFEADFEKMPFAKIEDEIEKANEAKLLEPMIAKLKEQNTAYERSISETEIQIKDLPNAIESKTNQIETEGAKLENAQLRKEHQLLIAKYEEDRKRLVADEACALCGSTSHPYASHQPKLDDDLDKSIKLHASQLKKFEKEKTELSTKLSQFQEKLKNDQKQLDVSTKELATNQEKWKQHFTELAAKKKELNWEAYIKKLKSYRAHLESLSHISDNKLLAQSILKTLQELNNIEEEGKQANTALKKVYQGDEDVDQLVNDLKSKWDKLSEKMEGIQNQEIQLKKEEAESVEKFDVFTRDLEEKVSSKGFSTIDESWKARLKEDEFQKLQNQQQTLQNKLATAQTKMKQVNEVVEEISQKTAQLSIDDVQQQLSKLKEEISNIEQQNKDVYSAIQQQKGHEKQVMELKISIKKAQKENEYWLLMDDLIGDAKGKKFNDFAQDLSLKQLLLMANVQMQKLNDRYQLDQPNAEEGEDLAVIDYHMGNERRSVRTLSGGETFVVSLALALALSDMASKNVNINSLFIDEGFGTLDPETLDQTLDTLERLQAESNKTIGIISHVEALKERIQTQIKLSKNGQGYSSLEVI